MKDFMSSKYYMVISVTVIALVVGVILSFVNAKTKDRIIEMYRLDFVKGLDQVLPVYANDPYSEFITVDNRSVYEAKTADNKTIAYAVQIISSKGYNGLITYLVGISSAGKVEGVFIVQHTETPGLGAKITQEKFLTMYNGIADPVELKIKKDGGAIDQISGATYSSRATSQAVAEALYFIKDNFKLTSSSELNSVNSGDL